MTDDDPLARLTALIAELVAQLPEAERATRIAWCLANGQHGASVAWDAQEDLEVTWGGSLLAVIPRATLIDADEPLDGFVYVPAVPDDISGLDDNLDGIPDAGQVRELLVRLDRTRLQIVAWWIAHRLSGDL